MRICAIDIGTNTFLLLIADIAGDGMLNPVLQAQRTPRIGRSVDAQGLISIAAFDRSVWILTEFRNLARQYRCDTLVACATSAVRDAANQEGFLRYLRSETGIDVEVLSGKDEAFLTYRGAISGTLPDPTICAVIDIGGGSTEIIYPSKPGDVTNLQLVSVQLGSVRITELFFHSDPPTTEELERARAFIRKKFQECNLAPDSEYRLAGVAGTVTTLACLDQHLNDYSAERVNGYTLRRQSIGSWVARLAGMTSAEIRALSGVTEGRADILTAGVLILETAMELCGFEEVIATDRGLRFGIAMREFERRRH